MSLTDRCLCCALVSWSISNRNFSLVIDSSSITVVSVSESELSSERACCCCCCCWDGDCFRALLVPEDVVCCRLTGCDCIWRTNGEFGGDGSSNGGGGMGGDMLASRNRTWPLGDPRRVPSDNDEDTGWMTVSGGGGGECRHSCMGDVATDLWTAIRRPSSWSAQQWKSHSNPLSDDDGGVGPYPTAAAISGSRAGLLVLEPPPPPTGDVPPTDPECWRGGGGVGIPWFEHSDVCTWMAAASMELLPCFDILRTCCCCPWIFWPAGYKQFN